MLCEIGHKEIYSLENLLAIALVAKRLPKLPVVCMENANLSANILSPVVNTNFSLATAVIRESQR